MAPSPITAITCSFLPSSCAATAIPSAADMDVDELMDGLVDEIEGLSGVHHLHVWSIDEELSVATLHAVAVDGADLPSVKRDIKVYLAEHDIAHSTVEMETLDEECPEDCPICPCVHSAECGQAHDKDRQN